MREAEENIKFKMEIDVLVPIPRTVTRDFTSLKHLRQWQKRNDIDMTFPPASYNRSISTEL